MAMGIGIEIGNVNGNDNGNSNGNGNKSFGLYDNNYVLFLLWTHRIKSATNCFRINSDWPKEDQVVVLLFHYIHLVPASHQMMGTRSSFLMQHPHPTHSNTDEYRPELSNVGLKSCFQF